MGVGEAFVCRHVTTAFMQLFQGPPSVSSKHGLDDMDTGEEIDASRMMFDFDQGFNQGFTQEQVDGECH